MREGRKRQGWERERKSASLTLNSWIGHCYNGTFAKSVWSVTPPHPTLHWKGTEGGRCDT